MNLNPFIEIERKYGLLDLNIEGYYYWIYLRTELKWRYVQKISNLQASSGYKKIKRLEQVKLRFRQIKNVLLVGKIPKIDSKLLVVNHPRRVLVDGLYECIYTDDIVDGVKGTVVLEEPYQRMHYKPAKTKTMVYTDIVDFTSYLYCVYMKYFHPHTYKNNKEIMLQAIRKPIEELNAVYGAKINPEQFANELIFGLCMYKMERFYYSRIINKLKPKAIIEVVSYNRKCMVINEIAEEKGIPTIELQHGVIGEEHIAYNYPEGCKIKQFPSYIFLFSEYWNRNTRFPIAKENRCAVGYPYLEKMARKYSGLKNEPNCKKNILFLSSGPIGDRLSKIAIGLNEILDKGEYHIIYKLHPGEYAIWNECYPQLYESDVEVIDNNKVNLYELFAISDIQVSGFNSTTVFEGLYFSLQTYILDYCVLKEIADLCADGIACYFSTASELAELIQECNTKKTIYDEKLWKKGGLQNILSKLDEIMGEKVIDGEKNGY